MTERKQMSVDMKTIQQMDRCAALLGLRWGKRVTRMGAVRVAVAELADKLETDRAEGADSG